MVEEDRRGEGDEGDEGTDRWTDRRTRTMLMVAHSRSEGKEEDEVEGNLTPGRTEGNVRALCPLPHLLLHLLPPCFCSRSSPSLICSRCIQGPTTEKEGRS